MITVIEHLIQDDEEAGTEHGSPRETRDALLKLLEERFGAIPARLVERLHGIQNHSVLHGLLRQMKNCRSLNDFEKSIEQAIR